ncbi:hypothetical protein GQ43DRAFT_477868 [Delitschia confertaspora ATCC 74209]|uniref:DUF7730 domain-containing protein n=1 Tax=Delitschia confertaspora ATCC 74209 TaxID=1513339 RepID=A0A9P4N2J2_9PLEO|nr:hypothetical protein GQ43DRAFT_477868 [Delitschia confertaspora ATCC 74209]
MAEDFWTQSPSGNSSPFVEKLKALSQDISPLIDRLDGLTLGDDDHTCDDDEELFNHHNLNWAEMASQKVKTGSIGMGKLHSLLKAKATPKDSTAPKDSTTPKESVTPKESETPNRLGTLNESANVAIPIEEATTPPENAPSPGTALENTAMHIDEKQSVEPSLLKTLPAEIRLLIYEELLVSDQRLQLSRKSLQKHPNQKRSIHTEILRTCKLMYEEGMSVLYGENIFDFGELQRRPHFAQILPKTFKKNASRIRQILLSYAAASEELPYASMLPSHRLLTDNVTACLSCFNISLSQLRLLAISIRPYKLHDPVVKAMVRDPYVAIHDWYEDGNQGVSVDEIWAMEKNAVLEHEIDGLLEKEDVLRIVRGVEARRRVWVEWEEDWEGRVWVVLHRRV